MSKDGTGLSYTGQYQGAIPEREDDIRDLPVIVSRRSLNLIADFVGFVSFGSTPS